MLLWSKTFSPPWTVKKCCLLSAAIRLSAAAPVAVEEASFPAPFVKNVESSFLVGAVGASAHAPVFEDSFFPPLTIKECCLFSVAVSLLAAAPAAIKEALFPAPFLKNVKSSFLAVVIGASAHAPAVKDSFSFFYHQGVLFAFCSHQFIGCCSCSC